MKSNDTWLCTFSRMMTIRRAIRNKRLLNPARDEEVFAEKAGPNEVDFFINCLNYLASYKARRMLSEDIIKVLDKIEKPTIQELALIEKDDSYALSAYFITNDFFNNDDISTMIRSKFARVRNMGAALAIVLKFPDLLIDDLEPRYLYLRHNAITEQELPFFSDLAFIEYFMARMQNETVMLNNSVYAIVLLIQKDHLNVSKHDDFFISFFNNNHYLSEFHKNFFVTAISKDKNLISLLLKCANPKKLRIDPFSKQIAFEQWLISSQKLLFLYDLIATTAIQPYSQQVEDFFKRVGLFRELNKFEHIISRFNPA